jgi:hypothetical protein
MITDSGFRASRLPQNLGTGQKDAPTATSWGRGRACGLTEETICRVVYQFCRSSPHEKVAIYWRPHGRFSGEVAKMSAYECEPGSR